MFSLELYAEVYQRLNFANNVTAFYTQLIIIKDACDINGYYLKILFYWGEHWDREMRHIPNHLRNF